MLGMNSPPAPVRIDLIRTILRDAVESIDELSVILCREGEWPALGVKLGDQDAFSISSQLKTAVGV